MEAGSYWQDFNSDSLLHSLMRHLKNSKTGLELYSTTRFLSFPAFIIICANLCNPWLKK